MWGKPLATDPAYHLLPSSCGGRTVFRIASKKNSSGSDPSIDKLSLTTVLGTAWTRYLDVHSGNSVASMASARTLSFSRANWYARRTARGQ